MSLKQLHMDGELPPFFGWVGSENKVCGSGEISADEEQRETQLDNLYEKGIRGIISLTEGPIAGGGEDLKSRGIAYIHLPVEDMTAPSLKTLLRGCEFIKSVEEGVLVHCREGVGRTGTMLAAWYISEGMSACEAVAKVRNARSGSIHKKAQEQMLYRFSRMLDCGSLTEDVRSGKVQEEELDALDDTFGLGSPSSRAPLDPYASLGAIVASPVGGGELSPQGDLSPVGLGRTFSQPMHTPVASGSHSGLLSPSLASSVKTP